MNKTVGRYLAMSVAAAFAGACAKGNTQGGEAAGSKPAAATSMPKATSAGGSVPCLGIHECKGKSACHVVGSHECAGQNACKGKGWIQAPRSECEAKGGKILDS